MKSLTRLRPHAVLAAAAAAVLALLVSCQSVPVAPERHETGETLLIIPLELDNQVGGEYPIVFSLNYDGVSSSHTDDLVDFGNTYAFLRGLAPGNHRISAMIVRWKPTKQILQQFDLNIPFTLTAGKATLLPVRFSIVRKRESTVFNSYALLTDQVNTAREDLKAYKNIESWEF